MKITIAQPKGQKFLPFATIFLLIVLSVTLAAWQVYAVDSKGSSEIQLYLPLFQAVLMILAIALGLTFHSVRTARIKSQDIMGLTHEGAGDSFKNTEAILGEAAGGIIRIGSDYKIAYINETALKYCGHDKDDATGKTIYDIVQLQNTNDKETLKKLLENQFESDAKESDWTELKLLNNSGELHLLKVKTTPVFDEETNSVRDLVVIMQDITSDRQAMQKLFDQASRDSLTGLINRHSFQNFMELVIAENESSKNQNVLCYMDLDHFKTVNDVCGHAAGDELLRQISEMFSKRLRSTDKLARIGGDEFAILLPNCNIKTAQLILNRILDDVRNFRFIWRQNTFVVGVSIGALEFDSGYRIADIGHLMVAVDEACYSAKKAGRNQLFIKEMERHEISLSKEDDNEDSWESTLKNAIEKDEYELYVQPVTALSSEEGALDKANFFEVLLRLKHEGKILKPGSFMPTAERLGLMGSVDRWVVSRIIEMIGIMNKKDQMANQNLFSINISSDSINDVEFTNFVRVLLEEHDVDPSQLCFEVSESDALANFSKVQSLFTSLVALGCCGSLDDFGSGFSSLNYLRELPIKYLKVDGTFVRKMSENSVDAAMVEAVNNVVQTMDIFTVAESVENKETAGLLTKMGIDFGQGYYYSRPMPVADIGDYQVAA
jgi:Amt family ammonium transporter